MCVGEGEARLATILAEPTDSDLLIVGGFEVSSIPGAKAAYGFLSILAKSSQNVADARVTEDLEGLWRTSVFRRTVSRGDVNRKVGSSVIRTVDLQSGGVCSYLESQVFQESDFDSNFDTFVTIQFDVDGVDLTNRAVNALINDVTFSNCTWSIDSVGSGVLALRHAHRHR